MRCGLTSRTSLRENGVPSSLLMGHRAVGDFYVFGLSFSTELGYTNMLTALDLEGSCWLLAESRDQDPIVIAGGHAAFNPEPISRFTDAAVLGDGLASRRRWTSRTASHRSKPMVHRVDAAPSGRLAEIEGVYVPSVLYDVEYLPDGRIHRVVPNRPEAPWRVARSAR